MRQKFKIPEGADEYTVRLIGLMNRGYTSPISELEGSASLRRAYNRATAAVKAKQMVISIIGPGHDKIMKVMNEDIVKELDNLEKTLDESINTMMN